MSPELTSLDMFKARIIVLWTTLTLMLGLLKCALYLARLAVPAFSGTNNTHIIPEVGDSSGQCWLYLSASIAIICRVHKTLLSVEA